MPKSKFMTKMYGGNKETPSILPKLSDDQIDELYSQMITMDGKFDAFPGNKREYVATVYTKMKEFLQQSGLSGGSRTGRYQMDDDEEKDEEKDKEVKVVKEKDESTQFKELTGIPLEAVKEMGEKRPKRVKISEGERVGEEVDNPFYHLPQLESVSMQDILNAIYDYKEDLKPFKEAMVKAFNNEEQAEQHLFYFFKAPKMGDFNNGPELKEAYEQRVNFFNDVSKPLFGFTKKYDNYTEGGTLLEVYTYESGLSKDYNIIVPDKSEKKIELLAQQMEEESKFAKFDFTTGNNTLEIKGSFKSEPQSSLDKLLLQSYSSIFRNGTNYHLFHLNKDTPDDYIKKQYNPKSDKSPDYTFEMDIDDFIDEIGKLEAIKDGKKTGKTLAEEIFNVKDDEVLVKTKKNIPINKLFEWNNLRHNKINKNKKILGETLKKNKIIIDNSEKQIRFNPSNDIVKNIIKFKKGKKKVKTLDDVYSGKNADIVTMRAVERNVEFID